MYFMIFIYSSSKRVLVRILPCSHLIMDGKEWVATIPLESSIHIVDNLLLYQTETIQTLYYNQKTLFLIFSQGCGSAFIFCGSGSRREDECGTMRIRIHSPFLY